MSEASPNITTWVEMDNNTIRLADVMDTSGCADTQELGYLYMDIDSDGTFRRIRLTKIEWEEIE